MKSNDILLIIIPCFNEEKYINILISAIRKSLKNIQHNYKILVIDDGSTDNTYLAAKNADIILKPPFNLGISAAVQLGIKYAKLQNFSFCLRLDGDGQHPHKKFKHC